jgi:hypothetical protein
MSRALLGAERVAEPLTEAYRTLYAVIEEKGWADFNADAVSYYYDRMICNWLLQLIDNALSDARLEAVKPVEVQTIVLLLFRDMFRHHAHRLRPSAADRTWIDALFLEIANRLGVPTSVLEDDGRPYELADMTNCAWATRLATPFDLPAEKLFVCHSAIVTGITEELGDRAAAAPAKPWWKFW